jgi:hypothetical protein
MLLSLNFAVICEGNELETYDVTQEGPNSTRAFVASEAGKVSVPTSQHLAQHALGEHEKTDCCDQQFSISYKNDLLGDDQSDVGLATDLYIDGECVHLGCLRAGEEWEVLGIQKTASSVLPFKFQELELVGAFPQTFLGWHVVCSSFAIEDPDVENAPVVPEIGTIELRTFRCRFLGTGEYYYEEHRLHQGRVSERGKKAGWHHVRYVLGHPSQFSSTCDSHRHTQHCRRDTHRYTGTFNKHRLYWPRRCAVCVRQGLLSPQRCIILPSYTT